MTNVLVHMADIVNLCSLLEFIKYIPSSIDYWYSGASASSPLKDAGKFKLTNLFYLYSYVEENGSYFCTKV